MTTPVKMDDVFGQEKSKIKVPLKFTEVLGNKFNLVEITPSPDVVSEFTLPNRKDLLRTMTGKFINIVIVYNNKYWSVHTRTVDNLHKDLNNFLKKHPGNYKQRSESTLMARRNNEAFRVALFKMFRSTSTFCQLISPGPINPEHFRFFLFVNTNGHSVPWHNVVENVPIISALKMENQMQLVAKYFFHKYGITAPVVEKVYNKNKGMKVEYKVPDSFKHLTPAGFKFSAMSLPTTDDSKPDWFFEHPKGKHTYLEEMAKPPIYRLDSFETISTRTKVLRLHLNVQRAESIGDYWYDKMVTLIDESKTNKINISKMFF